MEDAQVKVVKSPQNTSLADCGGVLGASALCNCKDVCLYGPSETDGD